MDIGAPIAVPLWLAVLVCGLALWAALDRLLVPSARWFLRRRVNRAIDELNTRLRLEIRPFALTKRAVLIDRLTYDADVMDAVEEYVANQAMPRQIALREVETYAREIVPAFNAYIYFRIGYWLARQIARFLYRVRLGQSDEAGLAGIDPRSTVIFVMNHRSNMDYVLVAYLAADRTALSYAVGEWARIWGLQALIRAMGAFFVRRNSNNPLYRRVLERYVQMATEGGVTQAMFPEGGLSRDGRLRPPKLGLLDYLVRAADLDAGRDVVFLPVALNYDRVLEDRSLLRRLDADAPRRSRTFAIRTAFGFLAHNLGLMLRGRWYRFGYACVNFGSPVSLRTWQAGRGIVLRDLDKEARFAHVEVLATDLLAAVGRVIPVLPVSLVATVFARQPERGFSELELKSACVELMRRIEAAGGQVYLPRGEEDYAIQVGLRMLSLRRLVAFEDGRYRAVADEAALIAYYANSIAHLLPAADGAS